MEDDDRIRKIYLYHTTEVRHVDGIALMATVSDDFADANNQYVCFEGRFPKYDNEIAIAAKYAREKGLKIGDEITLTADGVDIDDFNEDVSKKFGSDIYLTINIFSTMKGTATIYVSLMTIIVIAVVVLSAVIIIFVLYLLVRTLLNSKKRDYGIMKALGFTTGQLILQTALSFMPAVIVSTLLGITVSALVINPLTALFLRGIGIVKCTFTVPVGLITAGGAGLIVFAFLAACLLSLKVRRIAPKALLDGE